MKNTISNNVIVKTGVTDLRRSETTLSEIIREKIHRDPNDGNIYAFSNKTQMIVKLVKRQDDGIVLYKKRFDSPIKWPEYDKSSIILSEKESARFLKEIGLSGIQDKQSKDKEGETPCLDQ